MSEASINVDSSLESLVGQVADDFLRRQREGERPDIEEYLARYPQAAEMLRPVLASLRLLDCSRSGRGALPSEVGPAETEGTLGDFRIRREVGRGGMGVVYEAVQISLGRPVALKVLPFAAALDARQLQRFKNEAQAAACLHHINIVPVYSVGCERGVHFYAMQLIEGQSLASVIADLRKRAGEGAARADPQQTSAYAPGPSGAGRTAETETPLAQALSTEWPARSPAFFRSVARLGKQAAGALEHAHQVGVIHRDVKPGNLMIDVRANLWVTDFGLAHIQSDTRLTMTGDLIGTLRYMSPEQALAQRVGVDQRTDVYSLGATLYELLTLEPAFGGRDRQELLRQIAFDEPRPLRRISKAIPSELETVVLKAMAKNPAERYATAQELADDLGRYLEDRPIRARRPSLRQVLLKWARRHRAVVWATGIVLLVTALLAGGAGLREVQKRARAEGEAQAALQEAIELQKQEKWPEAISAVRRAKGVLASVWVDPDLRRRVEALDRDLEMARRLQEARLHSASVKDGHFDGQAADRAYVAAFAWYGLDVDRTDARQVGERIRECSSQMQMQLAVALDDWAYWREKGSKGRRHLLAISRVVAPDPWRNRLRDALEGQDPKALEELAASARADELPLGTILLLARVSGGTAAAEPVLTVLYQALQRHPDDFWLNHQLGFSLLGMRPPRLEAAIRYLTAATALRPMSPGARVNLGVALSDQGNLDEAITAYREAIRLKKDYAAPYNNLGFVLMKKRKVDEAIDCYKKAIALDPKYALAHSNLGDILRDGKQDYGGAIAHFRTAIALAPNRVNAHLGLGLALHAREKVVEAIECYRKAIRIDANNIEAHYAQGNAWLARRDLDLAIACYQRAIALDPRQAMAHSNLGEALARKGKQDEAIRFWRQAIAIDPNLVQAHYNLGIALGARGKEEEGIACYRQAIALDPNHAMAHCNLGHALARQGRFAESLAAHKRGHELGSKRRGWPYPSARWVRQAEVLAALEAKLPALLKGEFQPGDNKERLVLVAVCQARKLHHTATGLYAAAFATDPKLADDVKAGHRYNAACHAALAAAGQGSDADRLDFSARAGWRNQALAWLQADLAVWRKQLQSVVAGQAAQARETLEHWQRDPDLAGVRHLDQLARLPAAECNAWLRLWVEVARALQRNK
jgi:serine/threonine protein kinase/Flp pilus assembly protein TadD